jgi:hypothetical protein
MATIRAYTTIEQSRKLAEILPIESADMMWEQHYNNEPYVTVKPHTTIGKSISCHCCNCWSLAALMNLLPSEFTEKGKYSETTYKIDIRKYALTKDLDVYQIAYGNYKFYEDGNSSWKDMINTGEKESLIDACYEMIIRLHELNLL